MRAIRSALRIPFIVILLLVLVVASIGAQSKGGGASRHSVTLNVIVHAPEGKAVSRDDVDLYDEVGGCQ